jgi:RND family efflux transporter MFP subunit
MKVTARIWLHFGLWLFLAATVFSEIACRDTVAPSASAQDSVGPSNSPLPASTTPLDSPVLPATSSILSVLSVEHQVDLSSERDGVVVSVSTDEGSTVRSGEVLGQLDDRLLQMELVKARDELEVSKSNEKYKQAELKAKTAAYQRGQQLRALGLSSQADLEVAEFQAKGAEFDLQGWQALIERDQAEIKRIEIQLDQTRIHAPFSGLVVRRFVRQGQSVAKGDKCFRITQLGPLQVQFQVPETGGRRPETGATVDLALVGFPKRTLHARVVKVSPTVDPASDSYNVTAQLNESYSTDLRPGMALRVEWVVSVPRTQR